MWEWQLQFVPVWVSEQAPQLLTNVPGRADRFVFSAAVVESSLVLRTDGAALFCRFP